MQTIYFITDQASQVKTRFVGSREEAIAHASSLGTCQYLHCYSGLKARETQDVFVCGKLIVPIC